MYASRNGKSEALSGRSRVMVEAAAGAPLPRRVESIRKFWPGLTQGVGDEASVMTPGKSPTTIAAIPNRALPSGTLYPVMLAVHVPGAPAPGGRRTYSTVSSNDTDAPTRVPLPSRTLRSMSSTTSVVNDGGSDQV